jgi:hypothetical protein
LEEHIIIQKGTVDKERYYIPRNLMNDLMAICLF